MSWTASSAQAGKPNPDTAKIVSDTLIRKCYTVAELQYIAASLAEGKACDTLLALEKFKLQNRDSLIKEKNFEISQKDQEISVLNRMVLLKDERLTEVELKLAKEQKANRWLKIGLGSTTISLVTVLTIYLLAN